jgi:16S rRNA (cytidine1402-2'-O)-methyltransferase
VDRALVSAGALYVVATPLGNLGDLSDRAKQVVRGVSVVVAEDTRRSRILLNQVDAHPRVSSLHEHSPAERLESVIRTLQSGEDVALLTDAGTPAVSDPGAALVAAARRAGIDVIAIPGPSAVTAALSVAGFPADRYLFMGFPPRKGRPRHRLLEQAVESEWTVVLFESPRRLTRLLDDLAAHSDPDREAAVARELTKVHEECKTGTLSDLAVYYRQNPPRGEVTVLLAGRPRARTAPDPDELRERARALLAGGTSTRDVADQLAAEFSIPRREAYRVVISL